MERNELVQSIIAGLFLVIPTLLAVAITGMFGGAVSEYFPELAYWQGFWAMNLIAGTGWMIYLVVSNIFIDKEILSDYMGYLLPVVLFTGLLFLVPTVVWDLISKQPPLFYVPLISAVLGMVVMVVRHYKKLRFLNMSLKWFWIWIFTLIFPAVGWIWYYHAVAELI